MKTIAIIPARGGSKRIPKKNIKNFHGKPMIAWTIQRAVASNLFDRVIISTDDLEIANIAMDCGASFERLRDPKLSDSHTTLIEVMSTEAIDLIESNNDPLDILCCLYSTSTLFDQGSVYSGIQMIKEGKADFSMAVKEFEQSPMRAFVIEDSGYIKYKFPQFSNVRTQDIERYFTDAGQFTIARLETWARNKTQLNGSIYPVVLGKYEAIDIDEEADWKYAEEIFKIRLENEQLKQKKL